MDWQLSDGTELAFNCIVSSWSDFDAAWAFDWQPANATTAEWLEEHAPTPGAAAASDGALTGDRPAGEDTDVGASPLPAWCDVLRGAREKCGFTRTALARAVGIAEETLFLWYWALDWHPADAATWRWLAATG